MHGKLVVEIEAGNDAASTPADMEYILKATAEKIGRETLDHRENGGKVRDTNGNTVCRWTWTPDN